MEIELTEEDKAKITVEYVEERFQKIEFYRELSAIYFPSVVLEAELTKSLNKMQHLLANPPSRK
jgi:hypothetical protein